MFFTPFKNIFSYGKEDWTKNPGILFFVESMCWIGSQTSIDFINFRNLLWKLMDK